MILIVTGKGHCSCTGFQKKALGTRKRSRVRERKTAHERLFDRFGPQVIFLLGSESVLNCVFLVQICFTVRLPDILQHRNLLDRRKAPRLLELDAHVRNPLLRDLGDAFLTVPRFVFHLVEEVFRLSYNAFARGKVKQMIEFFSDPRSRPVGVALNLLRGFLRFRDLRRGVLLVLGRETTVSFLLQLLEPTTCTGWRLTPLSRVAIALITACHGCPFYRVVPKEARVRFYRVRHACKNVTHQDVLCRCG
jgi:hypothetical protein